MLLPSVAETGRSFFAGLLDRIRQAISQRNELQRFDRHELESIAYELNMSPAELGALVLMPSDSTESLDKRLAHANLSEAELSASCPEVLRDLRRVCSYCTSSVRCARDLRRQRSAAPSKYCPNEKTLQALAAGEGGSALLQGLSARMA